MNKLFARKKAMAKPRVKGRNTSAIQPCARHTITLPADLAAQIRDFLGSTTFGAFARRAFVHELQRERISSWLDEREVARGGRHLSDDAIAFAQKSRRARK